MNMENTLARSSHSPPPAARNMSRLPRNREKDETIESPPDDANRLMFFGKNHAAHTASPSAIIAGPRHLPGSEVLTELTSSQYSF